MKRLRLIALLPLFAALGACNAIVLKPYGDVAVQQRDLLVYSTVLILLIIIPVMVVTVLFAWRYRASNREARYEPDWDHSTQLELMIWSIPLLIIICIGALTWEGTHLLDPFRPLARIKAHEPVTAASKPLRVDVVALDWKWLFIYPDYGIASVNELAAPVDQPIDFHITASTVMNSFYIPALAGQIYAMPTMETRLHAVINKAGAYDGFSANYSGSGFSGMHFTFHGMTQAAFEQWLAGIKAGGGDLSRSSYEQLAQPSENVPVSHYAAVDAGLYDAILNLCVPTGKPCETGTAPMHMARNQGVTDELSSARMPGMDMSGDTAKAGAGQATGTAAAAPVQGAGIAPPALSSNPPVLARPSVPASGPSAL